MDKDDFMNEDVFSGSPAPVLVGFFDSDGKKYDVRDDSLDFDWNKNGASTVIQSYFSSVDHLAIQSYTLSERLISLVGVSDQVMSIIDIVLGVPAIEQGFDVEQNNDAYDINIAVDSNNGVFYSKFLIELFKSMGSSELKA